MAGMAKRGWTRAAREAAAARARQMDPEARRRGGQTAGLMWYARSPDERAAQLARLAAARGRQGNTSPRARRAQAARGRAAAARPHSAAQARLLAELGMVGTAPYSPAAAVVPPAGAQEPEPLPDRFTYPEGMVGTLAWHEAVRAWHRRRGGGDAV